MATISHVIRWADNTADLKRNLVQGIDQVEALRSSAEKMAKSLGGENMLRAAANMAGALEKIGGTSKLTATNQERVNDLMTKAVAQLEAAGKGGSSLAQHYRTLADSTRQVEQSTGGLMNGLKGVGQSILTTAAGFFTAQAAFAAVKFVAMGLVDTLKTLTVHGAGVADVAENFTNLTQQSGRLGETLMGELRAGTHNTISDFDLMKLATQDLAAGLNLTDAQFGTLSKGAFALAQATGGDVKTALETMNDAMLTGRTRALALLTGKIDLEKAEQSFAKSIGTTRDLLTEEGKLEAARIAILDGVGGAIERLGEQTDGLDERIAQAKTSWTNFQNELGSTVATSPVIMAAINGISEALTEAFGDDKATLVTTIARMIDDVAISLARTASVAVSAAGVIVTEWYAVKKLYGNIAQIIDGVTVATLYLGKAQMTLPNAIGIGTEAWKKNDDAIGRLMATMVARGQQLQADDKAQAGVSATTAEYVRALEGVVSKMEAARAGAVAHAGAVIAGSVATTQAGVAITQTGAAVGAFGAGLQGNTGLVKADAAAIKKLADEHKKLTKDVAEFESSLRGVQIYTGGLEHTVKAANDAAAAFKKLTSDSNEFESSLRSIGSGGMDALAHTAKEANDALQFMLASGKAFDKVLSEIANNNGLRQMAKDAGVEIDALTPKVAGLGLTFSKLFSDLPKTIMAAITGGGDVGKSIGGSIFGKLFDAEGGLVKSLTGKVSGLLGSTIGGAIGSVIPGLGTLLGSQLGEWMMKGLSKVGDWFKGLFGADGQEMEGRGIAAQFREQLEAMLTDTQKLEAGNERWKQSVIVVRDAYMAAGKSEQDALAIMDKLWKAEKQGGDAVRRVMEEIQAVLNAGLTPAATGFGTAMTDATTVATNGLTAMGAAAQVIKDQIAQPIVIPVEFEWSESERKAKSSGRSGLGPEDFASYDDWKKYFLENNPGDEHRAEDAYNSMHTGGVVDFAKWKRAHTGMLAHDEVPTILQAGEGVVRKEAMSLVGGAAGIEALNRGRVSGGTDTSALEVLLGQVKDEMAAARRESRGLPAAIKIAVQDAAALAPRRRAS